MTSQEGTRRRSFSRGLPSNPCQKLRVLLSAFESARHAIFAIGDSGVEINGLHLPVEEILIERFCPTEHLVRCAEQRCVPCLITSLVTLVIICYDLLS